MWRAAPALALLVLLAACSGDVIDRYGGPEAHSQEELDAVFAEVGLECSLVGQDEGCEVDGFFVTAFFFADQTEQRVFVDQADACDVTQLDYGDDGALLMGRGWVLKTYDSTDVTPLAERLGVDFIYPCDDYEGPA